MNLLDEIIEEIYSEESYTTPAGRKRVRVDMRVNCWGVIKRIQRTYSAKEWAGIKKCGSYLV